MKNPLIQLKTKLTNLPSENSDDSLVLPSTKENSDSLMKTEEFLDFVDDLSQKTFICNRGRKNMSH